MPKVFTVQSEGDALSLLFRKVGDLERMVTRPDVMASNGFGPGDIIDVGGINIGPPGGQVLVDLTQDPVTGAITLTPGSFMDDVFIDVSWTAVPDTPSYEVEMTKALSPGGPYSGVWTQRTGANNIRFRGLEPNTRYGFRLYAINHLGIRSTVHPSSGWQEQTTGEDSTIPPAVASVIIVRGASSALVKFTGLTEAQAADVANGQGTYHIQISTDSSFTSVSQEQYTTATIVSFGGIDAESVYYARVRAIDKSGNASAWTNGASGATVGGLIETMMVGDFSAALITYGTMDGDRIGANTLNVNRLLTANVLSARTITLGAGGQILINNPPTDGIALNSNGIRAYKSSVLTFAIDYDGTATFYGTVSGATINGGVINGTTLNGITLNVGLPPTEGITMNAFGLTAYAKPNWVLAGDRDGTSGNWVAWYNTTLTTSKTYSINGVSSLRARATAAGNMGMYLVDFASTTTGMFSASAGQTWTGRLKMRAGTTPRNCQIEVRFYSAAGGLLQVDAGVLTPDSASDFVEIGQATGVAPASTAKVGIVLQIYGSPVANENHYIAGVSLTKASDPSFKPITIDSAGSVNINGGDVVAETFRTSRENGASAGFVTTVDDGSGYIALGTKALFYTTSTAAYQDPARVYAKAAWSDGSNYGSLRLISPYEGANGTGANYARMTMYSGGPLGGSFIDIDADVIELLGTLQMGSNRIQGTNFGYDGPAISTRGGANNVYWDWFYDPSDGVAQYSCFVDNTETLMAQFDPNGLGPGSPNIAFFWNGNFVKSFVIPHPVEKDKLLVHACLEGETADVHYRGEGIAGMKEVEVQLPSYFEALTLQEHRSLDVFPVASANEFTDSQTGLEWTAIKNGKFRVRAKKAGVRFGYIVMAERKNTNFATEPLISEVDLYGDGPYTYLKPKSQRPVARKNDNLKKGMLTHG